MRRPLGTLALAAALVASPLAAQEAMPVERPDQAEGDEPAAHADGPAPPFGLTVVGGESQVIAAYPIGDALEPTRWVCLDRTQFVVVRANGEEVAYNGPGCLEPRSSREVPDEVYAGSHVWRPLSEESPRWSQGSLDSAIVVASAGPSAEAYPVGQRLAEGKRIVLSVGDRVTVLDWFGSRALAGPGTFDISATSGPAPASAAARPARRPRLGAMRGFASAPGPAAAMLIATRGTRGALAKFPRGTLIASPSKVCLAAGDRLTVAARSGARVTFAGPGCARKLDSADDDNSAAVAPG